MTRRAGTGSLVASPVLVGAVTVLVTIIAVFIAYNANKGLPFVPTYDLKAELPSGGKLVKGNEVRVGGFRVGVIEQIRPKTVTRDGRRRNIAEMDMKLDKTVEPLATDTTLRVRPRSVLGLKYIEVTPGRADTKLKAGETIPVRNSSKQPLDIEDLLSMFDHDARPDIRQATEGFGDAFAGRGLALNETIHALNPFFLYLTPVMRNLSDRDTRLANFFRQLGRASAQAAPVARTQAVLFTNMADTFAAISQDPAALQQTIERSPPTLDVSIRSFRIQRPFLADFADLSRRLRPAARELPRSLPAINSALRVGTPILRRQPELNRRIQSLNRELEELFRNPNTLIALRDLRTAFSVLRPAIEFIAPYQLVCNGWVYFWGPLGEHQSQLSGDDAGTVQNQGLKHPNSSQPNNYGTTQSSRNVDVPRDQDPQHARDRQGNPLHRLYAPPYPPAIDAQGNADCEVGQEGYLKGPLARFGRYPRGQLSDGTPTGGNWAVVDPNLPGLRGGTYVTRRLGIRNLRDIP